MVTSWYWFLINTITIKNLVSTQMKRYALVVWRTFLCPGRNLIDPTPVLLPGKIPWMEEPGRLQSMGSQRVGSTEQLRFHFSLSCIGEWNGNPLQCSCLENPRDRGAWWAAVYGVTQSLTRLKRLSSSSRNLMEKLSKWQHWLLLWDPSPAIHRGCHFLLSASEAPVKQEQPS